MLKFMKILFESKPSRPELETQEERQRIQTASCVLLLEVAKSDHEFSSVEKETIQTLLSEEFDIPSDAVEELIKLAEGQLEESVDLWEFTHLLNQNYTREEKIKVVESVWKVIYADEKLDGYEDHFVHKLARLLCLDHDELIGAKMKILGKIRR